MFRMRASGRDTFYVVQPHPHHHRCLGGIMGVTTSQDIARAVREGVRDLSQIMRTDLPKATPSTPLVDIYTMFTPGLPVAVVDEQDCLYGEVDQLDLLAHLAPESLPAAAEAGRPPTNGTAPQGEENSPDDSTIVAS
jgi:hypothetical protein